MKLIILLSQTLIYLKSSFVMYYLSNLEHFDELLCVPYLTPENRNNHTVTIIGLFDF